MDNSERFEILLKTSHPDLYEIWKLMDETQLDTITLLKYLNLIKNVQLVSGWGKVTTLIQNKAIKRVIKSKGIK